MALRAFVLAKNEQPNIERSVSALRAANVEVIVLDSGSSDDTRPIAESLGAAVVPYRYTDHLAAYRHICTERLAPGELALVLDADMRVSRALIAEVEAAAMNPRIALVSAPVEMWWEGVPLPHGSLCPPKAIALRGGSDPFEPSGHGEKPRAEVPALQTQSALIHDDRKAYLAYLASQERYAASLVRRASEGARLSFRDRLRLYTPLMLFLTPWVSLVVRRGLFAGRAGLLYALDRLIAEAIMFRQALSSRMKR